MATIFRVQTQLVTIHNRAGDRIRKARKTPFRTWAYYKNAASNVAEAVRYVARKMLQDHVGGIVVIRQKVDGRTQPGGVKIYQAKWGNDNRQFGRWEGPAGDFWRRRMPPSLRKWLSRLEIG